MCLRVSELFLLGGIGEEVVGSFFYKKIVSLSHFLFCFFLSFYFGMKTLCGIYDFIMVFFYFGFQIFTYRIRIFLIKKI